MYRTHAIISRGLYFFFTQFSLQLRLILQTIYVLKTDILHFLSQNPRLINKTGFKLKAAYDGARTVLTYMVHYGNTGCGVFKWGVTKLEGFFLNQHI